ncbi:hypothetical protein BSL82_01180 [Tardibacter chloracetimidivorans]|uniref:HTH cro/C1-type domain-containing protein n=1 Tax=Tardibacter chloracetimidivorans TaxID=1921510 RepID=A0A1L3ZR25_9SPHN|nr:hypothetical protein BSL82_01180 [Tardibacter chloracetimidivorans]
MVSETIHAVRALLREPGVTRAGLAIAAGLHPNTLRDVEAEGWNPTASTLLALESYMEARRPRQQASAA